MGKDGPAEDNCTTKELQREMIQKLLYPAFSKIFKNHCSRMFEYRRMSDNGHEENPDVAKEVFVFKLLNRDRIVVSILAKDTMIVRAMQA